MTKENRKLYEAFVSNMRSSGKSENTIINYSREVKEFLEFIGDKNFVDMEFADCEDFQSMLNDIGNSSSTISHKRSALSTFTKYVKRRLGKKANVENEFILMDSLPKQRVKPLVIWEKKKILEMIDYFQDKDLRLSTLLALAFYSGRRRAEIPRFKVSDFTDDKLIGDGKFWVSDEIKTKGRGDHKLQCFVLTGFKPYLDRWLTERTVDSEWLFPDERNADKHISNGVMDSLAEKVQRVSKYEQFHWHMLRHAIVTNMLDSGVPADIVVKIMGWADAKMLSVYDDRDKVNVIDKYFKDTNIKI